MKKCLFCAEDIQDAALRCKHCGADLAAAVAKERAAVKVEHPFHVVKNLLKHRKARYRGLAKNTAQLHTLFGLANLVLARRHILDIAARGASAV